MSHTNPRLKRIADETIETVRRGFIEDRQNRCNFDLKPYVDFMMKGTRLYSADNRHLVHWRRQPRGATSEVTPNHVRVEVQKMTTLRGVMYMWAQIAAQARTANNDTMGVLNFASAARPGGGFRKGASAQEESLARSSTLFKSLESHYAKQFYDQHKADGRDPFYSHAMIYSPQVVFFRDDNGGWLQPMFSDVLTCAAVNAKEVRLHPRYQSMPDREKHIERAMTDRMGRILELFEYRGVRNLVLGSFGTGVFQNDVRMVAKVWRELLRDPDARFRLSFDRVLFAIPDERTEREFNEVFFNKKHHGGRKGNRNEGHDGGGTDI